jgi:DNA polymerase I-like protein with 3'-5' exonuclease and polymerase domains
MLIEGDASGLEWRTYVFLSQDYEGLQEIVKGEDIHSNNQKYFKLPERLVAKKFLFRGIYRGPAWSYAHDPEFSHVSTSEKFWQKIIDAFFEKYYGLAEIQKQYIEEVSRTGKLVVASTGRTYEFDNYGTKDSPMYVAGYKVSQIVNYPNQGMGDTVMAVARTSARKRLAQLTDCKLVDSVHDSIIVDTPEDTCDNISTTLIKCFNDVPLNFKRHFGVDWNVPIDAEIKIGKDWGHMTKMKGH